MKKNLKGVLFNTSVENTLKSTTVKHCLKNCLVQGMKGSLVPSVMQIKGTQQAARDCRLGTKVGRWLCCNEKAAISS